MADEPLIPAATGQPIVVDAAKPAVSVEQVGDRPVAYTGNEKPQAPEVEAPLSEQLQRGLQELFGATPAAAADLDTAYGKRLDERTTEDLDRWEAGLAEEDKKETLVEQAKGAAADVARGVFVEGLPAAVVGAQNAVNETLDMIESVADEVPMGVITWGPDGLQAMSGKEAKKRGFAERFLPRFRNDQAQENITTNTGQFIAKASQFATGMVGAGKVLKGWTAATRGGQFAKAAMQGAISDFSVFDPHEERLANMLSELTHEQAGPIVEFLAANKEDPELLGRTKNALEGLGLGVGVEAVMGGLRAVKAARMAKKAARAQAEAQGFSTVGADIAEDEAVNIEKELTRLEKIKPQFNRKVNAAAKATGKLDDKIGDRLLAEGPDLEDANPFKIKFDTFETGDDIKKVIGRMTKEMREGVDEARRGVRTWEQTGEASDKLSWVELVAKRRDGQGVSAEELLAYKQMVATSAERVKALATANSTSPTLASRFALRRAVAVHHAIQQSFMGARAEVGRSLNAMKIPVGTPREKMTYMDRVLQEMGGPETADELAKAVLKAAQQGDVVLNEVLHGSPMARSKNAIKLIYTNGLMSAFSTIDTNLKGNSINMLLNLASRAVAPRLTQMVNGVSAAEIGEATAMVHGYMSAVKDMFRLTPSEAADRIAKEDWRSKGMSALAPGLDDATPDFVSKMPGREDAGSALQGRPLSAAAWGADEDSLLGKALDVTQTLLSLPTQANKLGDDFFRVISARGELAAQAFRKMQVARRSQKLTSKEAAAMARDLMANPTDDMIENAIREMEDLTFTRTGGFDQKISSIRRMIDNWHVPLPLGTMIMPFVRTPANIMSTAMRYTPLAKIMPRYGEEIAAGGARAEIAKARVATGVALWAVMSEMAMNGDITGAGPTNRAQKDAMMREDEEGGSAFQPYSLRVGSVRLSFSRLAPLGTLMGLAGDWNEMVGNGDWSDSQVETGKELVAHTVVAGGHAMFGQSSLVGVSNFLQAVAGGDSVKAKQMLDDMETAFLPMSSQLRSQRRAIDPYMREVVSAVDVLRNSIPGLSDDLPVSRDLWGKPKTFQSALGGVYDMFSGVKVKKVGGSMIDADILDNGIDVAMPVKSIQMDGETASLRNRPDIYMEFVRLAGEPAFEQLEAVASGNHPDSAMYFDLTDGPDGGKAEYIKDVVEAYRKQARSQILDIYGPELQLMAGRQSLRKAQARGQE